jgi:ammonium transporter Rh
MKDVGGAMYIHTFGAFFGVGASFFLRKKEAVEQEHKIAGGYMQSVIAIAGTIFLYMYWPSFNAVWAHPANQLRIIVNTALAISASCIAAFTFARWACMKCDMEIALSATFAGGIAMGACCDNLMSPGIAIAIGALAGLAAAYGRAYLTTSINKWGFHDTCGVLFVHGVPGIIGSFASAVTTANADLTFPNAGQKLHTVFGGWMNDRVYNWQGAAQIFALLVTIGIAFFTGMFTGLLASFCSCGKTENVFEDKDHWEHAEYDAAHHDKAYSEASVIDTDRKN